MSNHDRLTTTPAVNNSIGIHGTIVTKKWHQRFMKNQGYHHERSSVQKPVIYLFHFIPYYTVMVG